MVIPVNIISGATVVWRERRLEFPSSLWRLSYHLRGVSALDVIAEGQTDDSFLVTLLASKLVAMVMTPLPAGQYFYQALVTNLSNNLLKEMVDNGRVEILPDLSSSGITSFDGRSQAEIGLEAVRAMIIGKATRDQARYTIGSRSIDRIPLDQLVVVERNLAAVVAGEKMQARVKHGESPFETIYTEFGLPRRGRQVPRDEFFGEGDDDAF